MRHISVLRLIPVLDDHCQWKACDVGVLSLKIFEFSFSHGWSTKKMSTIYNFLLDFVCGVSFCQT